MSTYRTGNHQPQNVYRDDAYIGVMFTAEDAALVVEALNEIEELRAIVAKAEEEQCGCLGGPLTIEWVVPVSDSCTCPFLSGADPACPVHQGRKARGPKPPALGPGCICDGSGRTCPRHGVVL
jgi:hypothetical protein